MKNSARRLAKNLFRRVPVTQRNQLDALSRSLDSFVQLVPQTLSATRGYLYGQRFATIDDGKTPLVHARANPTENNAESPLAAYFDRYSQGPGIWKWRHYLELYHRHLAKFIDQEAHVLEIGIYSGGSLEMWKEYFGRHAQIYGVDIMDECKSYEGDAVRIFIGDQADENFWRRFKGSVPVLDVAIDDGGHQVEQQIASLEALLPHLRPGGVYICEDIHGITNRFHAYICGLTRNMNSFTRCTDVDELASSSSGFQRHLHSVHLYPFAVVIEKRATEVEKFVAPRRGTDWQPKFQK